MLLHAGWAGNDSFKMLCGGEALATDLAARLLAISPHLWNMYGPTETTIWSSATKVVNEERAGLIGPPIANTQFYVLTENGKHAPIGVRGEICIGGTGLARGYWDRAELTRQQFIPSPFGTGRIYRTGDIGRWVGGGRIEIAGRTDHQVKIRGYRVELGDIENAIRKHPDVREVVVVAQDDGIGHKRLAAFLELSGAAVHQNGHFAAGMRRLLGDILPDYMIPATIVPLPALPRTPNGKIDRRSLPSGSSQLVSNARSYVPPETPLQQRLNRIWCDVLKLEKISIEDSILELGGDSLLIFRIVAVAQDQGIPVTPALMWKHGTIAALAAHLSSPEATPAQSQPRPAITAVPRDRYRRTVDLNQ
jgi:hypothetical protein